MAVLPDAKPCDVLVAGMGPAGATAAFHLSRAGLSVIGLEKQRMPRYKVCGGGLSARIGRILEPDFSAVVEHTVCDVRFAYEGQKSFLIQSSSPIAFMVMRDRFDRLLAEEARRAGTDVHEGEGAVEFRPVEDGVEVLTESGRYRAKVLIGADGASSLVARRLFPERRLPCMAGLESEIGIGQAPLYPADGTVLIDVGAATQGYGWIFPKQERLSVGVAELGGAAGSPKGEFDRFVRGERRLRGLTVPAPHGHPLPLYPADDAAGARSLVHGQALLVGDAGHLVDPLFGEGIYYAVRSGQLAAASVLKTFRDRGKTLHEYERAVERELYPEFRVASRLAGLLYTMPRLCYEVMSRYQEILSLYCQVLQGKETYQTFFGKGKRTLAMPFKELLNAVSRAKSR